MIAYLPEIYPDELVYSWFCRYYVHTGCLTHKSALNDILSTRHDNPSKEFLGHINAIMRNKIQDLFTIEQLIVNHTMFSQYARFIPLDEKKRAIHHLADDYCDAHHLFSILPRNESDQYLKYCPRCVVEDRRQYGEAYWHRVHQIRNMQICTRHNCRLVNSSVVAKSEQTFTLCPVESYVVIQQPIAETNELKIAFAQYMVGVFNAPIEWERDIPISAVLYHSMVGTNYLKSTGKSRNTNQFAADINNFYKKLDIGSIASLSQIQRALFGDRFDFSVICQIAFFLGISVDELTAPRITKKQIEQAESTHYIKNREPIDWVAFDAETAPQLEQIAKAIYDGKVNGAGRPERVSEKLIYREMKLPAHRLENLPHCKAIMDRYSEPYEENWARRIIWAYNRLLSSGEPFYWSDIRRLTGVKKQHLERVIPLIRKHTDKSTAEKIEKLLM